jgi:FkbM family methyltransferase
MASRLANLFRDLLNLREFRARRPKRLPWRIRIAYFRNVIRHQALDHWPGGYILRTDGRFAYVPAHVDVTVGHRLFKPVEDANLVNGLCRPGDVVVDVGANVGDWTMPFALRVGPKGQVIAFEPVPYLADAIAKTARINRHDWVEVHTLALSGEDGSAKFSVERGNSGGSRLGLAEGDFDVISVPTRRLDSILSERADVMKIDLVKIDVEGHEIEVLVGARNTLARFRPYLILESGFESETQRKDLCGLLIDLNYEIVGAIVPGGVIEIGWDDYRDGKNEVERIGLCNYLFIPKGSRTRSSNLSSTRQDGD